MDDAMRNESFLLDHEEVLASDKGDLGVCSILECTSTDSTLISNLWDIEEPRGLLSYEDSVDLFQNSMTSGLYLECKEDDMYVIPMKTSTDDTDTCHTVTQSVFLPQISQDNLSCNICGMTFSCKAASCDHQQLVHRRQNVMSCPPCDYRGSLYKDYARHWKKKHSDSVDVNSLVIPHLHQSRSITESDEVLFCGGSPENLASVTLTSGLESQSKVDSKTQRINEKSATKQKNPKNNLFCCSYPQCSKSFKKKTSLQAHVNIHTGRFSCSEAGCGKCFRDQYNLEAHSRVHNGEKCLQCLQCSYKCSQLTSLKHHMHAKH